MCYCCMMNENGSAYTPLKVEDNGYKTRSRIVYGKFLITEISINGEYTQISKIKIRNCPFCGDDLRWNVVGKG